VRPARGGRFVGGFEDREPLALPSQEVPDRERCLSAVDYDDLVAIGHALSHRSLLL
jgi:hypothetical protein